MCPSLSYTAPFTHIYLEWCLYKKFFNLSYLQTVVSPTSELHFTALIVKREPCNINFACALEDTRGYIHAASIIPDHDIRSVRSIETFVRTAKKGAKSTTFLHLHSFVWNPSPRVCLAFAFCVVSPLRITQLSKWITGYLVNLLLEREIHWQIQKIGTGKNAVLYIISTL